MGQQYNAGYAAAREGKPFSPRWGKDRAAGWKMWHAEQPRVAAPVAAPADPIRAAYLAVTGGKLNCRARIADIKAARPAITDWDLLAYARAGLGSLIEMDNRREITANDRAAAVQLGGEPRHILWIER